MSTLPEIDRHAVEERAARWLMRREAPGWSETEQAALDAWLGESMAHKAAYWRLEYSWRQADRIGALSAAPAPRVWPGAWFGRHWRPMAVAATLAFAVLLGVTQSGLPGSLAPVAPTAQRLATRIGGHSIVPLNDGSKIELNTATMIRASVDEKKREVWLDQGEAYFEVKHSNTIPFVVYAGPRTVTVLGTKFSVRRDGDKVTVSVVEGRVRVEDAGPKPGGGTSSIITTGDVVVTEGSSTLVAAKAPERVETGLAWRDGMLNFDQVTLGEAAGEFNRYNDRQLVIADPQIARIRIGGSFRASNIDAFVRLLHDAYGLDARVEGNEIKVGN